MSDRYRLLSPAVAEVELSSPSPISRLVRRGWEIIPKLVSADVSDAVFAILVAPHLLDDELQRRETTLTHGDLHLANVGLGADRVILLDWGFLVKWGLADSCLFTDIRNGCIMFFKVG